LQFPVCTGAVADKTAYRFFFLENSKELQIPDKKEGIKSKRWKANNKQENIFFTG